MYRNNILIFLMALAGYSYGQDGDVLKYSMKTRWGKQVDPNNVWNEYPRPQMTRGSFINLNGHWEYAIQPKDKKRPKKYEGKILVPFAVESDLSGVKKLVGEHNYLWYRRTFQTPTLESKERLLIHFGAVDWETQVSINGKVVGTHQGGYDAFSFDITDYLGSGDHEIVVRVWDPSDKGTQARGKQVSEPFGIWYTPVTGIWQTVWLEKVPVNHIELIKPTPDIDTRQVEVEVRTTTSDANMKLKVQTLSDGKEIDNKIIDIHDKITKVVLNIPEPRLWSPEDPYLYDLEIEIVNQVGETVDHVASYFGMRKISLGKDGKGYTRIMLNNKPVFQFGLLDQGWWPDGLYTAPTEEAMLYDIKMTKEMGFNMLRKHVKVEPARFYYNCDKMGMLVWQDMPNGNYLKDLRIQAWETKDAIRTDESARQFEAELKEMMDEFHQFPSILVWVPFNEGWGQYDTERVTAWVEKYDPSRLIDSPSGWADRGVGDMIDVHLYPGPGMEPGEENRASVLGEFGGLGHPVKNHLWWDRKNWGYLTFSEKESFINEFEKLMDGMKGLIASGLSAAVYTQTTDVEGEVNGLITYDREIVKIQPAKLRELIEPLYKTYWDTYILVPDSKLTSNKWKVTSSVQQNWFSTDYNDFAWKSKKAPLSTYDNFFLNEYSDWKQDKLYLRKSFNVVQIPSSLYLKHYLPKTKVKIYLNGELIKEHEDKGGRKRHYTHIDISKYVELLKKGKNVVAVELEKMDEEASFDLGIYTTERISTGDVATEPNKESNQSN